MTRMMILFINNRQLIVDFLDTSLFFSIVKYIATMEKGLKKVVLLWYMALDVDSSVLYTLRHPPPTPKASESDLTIHYLYQ